MTIVFMDNTDSPIHKIGLNDIERSDSDNSISKGKFVEKKNSIDKIFIPKNNIDRNSDDKLKENNEADGSLMKTIIFRDDSSSFSQIDPDEIDIELGLPYNRISRKKSSTQYNVDLELTNDKLSQTDRENTKFSKVEHDRKNIGDSSSFGIQLMLKKIGEKAGGYKWMHKQEQFYNEGQNDLYKRVETILLIILGAITGGEFVAILANTGLHNSVLVSTIITIIEIIILTIYAIVKSKRDDGNFETLVWQHQYMSSKFGEMNLDIQEKIGLQTSDKPFLRQTIKLYNQLMETAVTIREETIHRYIEGTKDVNIYRPLIVGDFDQIEIVISNNEHEKPTEIRVKDNNEQYVDNNNGQHINKNGNNNRIKYELERYLKNM